MPADDLTITKNPRRCGGDPTVGPTRICVHDIVCHLRLCDGSVEAYLADYPHHTQAQVQAALDYYREHPEEIDEILRERREDFNERLALQEARQAAQEALLAAARREARETIACHFEAQAEQAFAGKKLVGRFARAEELLAVASEIREVEV